MSDQPNYQAPPPGYQPPPAAPGSYEAAGYPSGTFAPYAGWWSRVGAILLDSLIGLAVGIVPIGIGAALAFKDAEADAITGEVTGGINGAGLALIGLGYLLVFAFQIWNVIFRQGRKGQTLGKQVVGIQVVKADTGQFLGAGTAFVRWLVGSILGGLCLLNYLWPLWDDKKQTWHDKIVGSVVTAK